MGAPIPLRRDYDGLALCALARHSKDADQTRRLLALASIYDGGSRSCGGQAGRGWSADRPGLGSEFQCAGAGGVIDRRRRTVSEMNAGSVGAREK